MDKRRKILIGIAIPLVILIIILIWYLCTRVRFNDDYVNGNTAGNLYNQGLFCESNGTVFFANPDDDNKLYSMNPDGSNLKKLCNDTVSFINADSHYIYYVRNNDASNHEYPLFAVDTNSLCRISRKGGDVTVLDKAPCIYATLVGNYIYYLHYSKDDATTLYSIKIDGTEKQKVSDIPIYTCSTLGQYIYYHGIEEDSKIYRLDTATGQSSVVYDCKAYKPIVVDENNIYYLDPDQNNCLIHTSTEWQNPTIVTTDSIDHYNIYGSYIYYQRYDKDVSAFCRIKNDGSDFLIIAEGNYKNINITSEYIFFQDFKTNVVYQSSLNNPSDYRIFNPGIDN